DARLVTPVAAGSARGHFLTFELANAQAIHDRLARANNIPHLRGERLRLRLRCYHTPPEIEAAGAANSRAPPQTRGGQLKISEALARSRARLHVEAETHWGHASRGPNERTCVRSVRQRIGPHLDVYGARLGALAAFLQPRRAVAVRAPQAAALTAGIR